jgi:hypothetical protein
MKSDEVERWNLSEFVLENLRTKSNVNAGPDEKDDSCPSRPCESIFCSRASLFFTHFYIFNWKAKKEIRSEKEFR